MSWFKNIINKVSGMKDNTEQQEIMNKINDTYESIVKGVEELNAKVVSVKELKIKLKNLPPPPPPEKPNEIVNSSEEEKKKKEKEEDIKRKQKEEEDVKRKQKEEEEKNKVAPPIIPIEPGNIVTKTSSDAPLVPREASDSSSSPLPMPGALDAASQGDSGSLGYDGGKKRKTRAKAKRTISKNKNNSNKRTRKNKNKNKEETPSEANTEAAAQVT